MKKTISFIIFLFTTTVSFCQYIDITGAPYYAIPNDNGDDSTAIQKAIDENPNKTIFFPSGKFIVAKTIIINHPIEIIGNGINNTTFTPANCNGFLVKSSNVAIKNMFIYGYENDSKAYTGIFCDGKKENRLSGLYFESIRIQNIVIGIELKYTWDSVMDKVRITINPNQSPAVNQGIRFYGQSVNNMISNCNILSEMAAVAVIREKTDSEKARIENPNDPLKLRDLTSARAEGLMITNSFLGYGKYGIYSEGILSMNVSNCTIDLTTRTAIEGTRTDGLLLSNNWISSKSDVPHPIIKLIASIDGHMSSNNINTTANNNVGISFESDTNKCTVIGNTIKGVQYKTYHYSGAENNIVIYNH